MSVILVVGASSGLGKATALRLVAEGYTVYGTSRFPDRYPDLGFPLLQLDVRDGTSIAACLEEVMRREGRLDGLVNCAGYDGPCAAVEESSEAQGRALMETNFFGAVRLMQAVLPIMRAQGGGKIINVTSVAGPIVPAPFFAFYPASKAALDAFSEALRLELLPLGIDVSVVRPSFFRTPIYRTMEPPAHPLPTYAARRDSACRVDRYAIRHGDDPQKVGAVIAAIIRDPQPAFAYPVGHGARLMTAARRCLPAALFERLLRFVLDGPPLPDDAVDDETIAAALGWRRLFLVQKRVPLSSLRLGGGLIVLGGMGFVLWRWLHHLGGKE